VLNTLPGQGLFTPKTKIAVHMRRGLQWHIARGAALRVTVYGHGYSNWERCFHLPTQVASDYALIDRLYFTQLVDERARSNPLDGVPWEIHDIENSIAYEVALAAYKEAL